MSKKLINDDSIRAGMQVPDWLFDLYRQVARVAEYQLRDANAEALFDWIMKIKAKNSVARAALDEILKVNPETHAKYKQLKSGMDLRRSRTRLSGAAAKGGASVQYTRPG